MLPAFLTSRISQEDIDSLVEKVEYFRPEGTTFTQAFLTCRNGHVVTGSSACIDPDAFVEHQGRHQALNDAKLKLWELEAYRVRSENQATLKQMRDAKQLLVLIQNSSGHELSHFPKSLEEIVSQLYINPTGDLIVPPDLTVAEELMYSQDRCKRSAAFFVTNDPDRLYTVAVSCFLPLIAEPEW